MRDAGLYKGKDAIDQGPDTLRGGGRKQSLQKKADTGCLPIGRTTFQKPVINSQ
jgi:hypothetical protein